jgi:tetratricopeptide (TPR) repeat protein
VAGASSSEKKWLIKSSGMISGPFSFDEIVEQLKVRKVAMIDEVRSPDSRWLFIRENKIFADVVRSLRDADVNYHEETLIGSKTVTHHPEDLTSTPPPVRLETFVELDEPEPVEAEKPKLAAYASSQDPRVQKRVQPQKSNLVLGLLLVVLAGLIGFAFFQYSNQKSAVRSLGYDDFVRLARENKQIGLFEKALEFYRKAESLRSLDIMTQMQMVPLLMIVENQNVQARQILESLKSNEKVPAATTKTVDNLIALSYLREGRLDEAQKRYQAISKVDPANEPAQINLVEISILQGRFDEAIVQLTALMKAGFKDPVLFLFRILTIYRTVEDPIKLAAGKSDLARLIAQSQNYQAEMLLLHAAIETKLYQTPQAAETIRKVLNTDPDLTRKHIHDFLIHREVLEWGYLGNICDLLVKSEPNSALYKGLSAYCSYEQGDLKAALDKIEKSSAQFTNDVQLLGLHSFLLYRSGRTSEAKAVVQLPKAGESELALTVKATLCQEQKDWNCAEETWEKVRQLNPQNLAAFAGLTRVALQSGHKDFASDTLKRGLLISNQYQPFLELKDVLHEP